MIAIATEDGVRTPEALGVSELGGHAVSALAAAGGDLWALVDQAAVWRRRDGEWAELAADTTPRLRCLLPRDGGALAGTAEAHLVRVGPGAVAPLDGFERAPGRGDWFTPWGGPPAVRTLAAGAAGELYVNVHVGGILRSDDEGAAWRPTIDIRSDVHQVLAVPGRPGLVLAATALGMATSEDGGASWSFAHDGLAGRYCRAVALAGDTVLLSASQRPAGRRGGGLPPPARSRRPLPALHGRVRAQHRHGLPGGRRRAGGVRDRGRARLRLARCGGQLGRSRRRACPRCRRSSSQITPSDCSPRDGKWPCFQLGAAPQFPAKAGHVVAEL